MAWNNDEPQDITKMRLFYASPEVVYQELKIRSSQITYAKSEDIIEDVLLSRNDKVINIGLAQYATSTKVLSSLYEMGCKKLSETEGDDYCRALRIGCLSNPRIFSLSNMGLKLPDAAIEDLTKRGLKGAAGEIYQLILNPSASSELFNQLYTRTGLFADASDGDWMFLVYESSNNPRLNTNKDNDFMPDLGHLKIHSDIYGLLKIAPLKKYAISRLYFLFDGLNPEHTPKQDDIAQVLERWRGVEMKDSDGEEEHGHFTQLSLKEEFLCLIAALYGKGKPTDKDIALRCAYYGNGAISVKEMKAAIKREQSIFVFAAIKNRSILLDKTKQAVLEEEIGGDANWRRYLDHCRLIHQDRKWFKPTPITEYGCYAVEDILPPKDENALILERIIQQNESITQEFERVKRYFFWAVVLMCLALYYWR